MSQTSDTDSKKRKKKASRACSHCQKAHLTCDDSRPCQRCIKRGLQSTCADGARKKAKYLQDDEYDDSPLESTQPSAFPFDQGFLASPSMDQSLLMNLAGNHGFGSESANMEYGILSNMLQNNDVDQKTPQDFAQNAFDTGLVFSPWTTNPILDTFRQVSDPPSTVSPTHSSIDSLQTSAAVQHPNISTPQQLSAPEKYELGYPTQFDPPIEMKKSEDAGNTGQRIVKRRKGIGNSPDEIYARVRKPYNHAEGYHYLIQHVKQRMGRQDLMRISRALALFRPSFISMVANLTEEDLTYMEKCVQRTLLEFEKLISFSGTPTVIWRRTGEIVLVGKEFSLLTQWSKEALLGKKTYIYELMDNGSVVEYWEKYSMHAFDPAESAVFMSVILMSPTYRPVPCSFCFTIKRDIFDLPSVIVGNFLPILSASTTR